MSVDRRRGTSVAVGALALLLNAALGAFAVRAQTTAEGPAATGPAGYTALGPALQATLQTGRPTVVVVTSRSEPASMSLRDALPGLLQTQPVGNVVLLAEMPVEQHAERVRSMGVSQVPAVLVYGRGGTEMQLLAHRVGLADPYQVTGWLGSLGLDRLMVAATAAPAADATVQRTSGGHYPSGQYPSQQAPPPPVYKSEPQPQPQPVYVPQPQQVAVPYTPTYAAPSPQPVVVAPPSQPVVVAPPAQTIMVAPAPAPNIVFSAPTQPTVMMAPVASAPSVASAPTNAFLAPTQPAAAPVAMAPAPAPVAMAPVAMAPAPAPVAMAPPVGQAPQVGQGPVTTAFLTLVAPTLFERILGAIGQRLAERGQPRLSVGQSPTVSTMAMAPTAMGQAPIAMMAPQAPPGYQLVPAYPQGGPPPGYGPPPPHYGYAPPEEPYVPPNAPSPQSYHRTARAPSKHGW